VESASRRRSCIWAQRASRGKAPSTRSTAHPPEQRRRPTPAKVHRNFERFILFPVNTFQHIIKLASVRLIFSVSLAAAPTLRAIFGRPRKVKRVGTASHRIVISCVRGKRQTEGNTRQHIWRRDPSARRQLLKLSACAIVARVAKLTDERENCRNIDSLPLAIIQPLLVEFTTKFLASFRFAITSGHILAPYISLIYPTLSLSPLLLSTPSWPLFQRNVSFSKKKDTVNQFYLSSVSGGCEWEKYSF